MCAVVHFCCQVTRLQYCTSVPALTGSSTFVVRWFCRPQCTNTLTLTFIALRQLRCRCSLNYLVLWIHNPARSVALRSQLHFLQKHFTVTCKRFSTQQLRGLTHMSNCVGPAWFGVGMVTSICDSHPYLIRCSTFRVIPRVLVKFARSINGFGQWNASRSWAAILLHDRCLLVPWNTGINAAPKRETEKVWTHSEEFRRQFVWA